MDDPLRLAIRRFDRGKKKRKLLSTSRIIFLVIAAAAPLGATIGNLPIALGRGNGAGVPGAYVVAMAILLCFAIGYGAMGKRIVNTGALYTFIAKGLGKPIGVGSAFLAVTAYTTYAVSMAAACGYFATLIFGPLGLAAPWWLWAGIAAALVAFLGYRSIDLSSRVLGYVLAAEVAILVLFDVSVIAVKGQDAFPLISYAPATVFAPGFAVALMCAMTSFVGFESAALYGEEAKDPARSIPRATIFSVVLIGVFYMLTAWITVGAMGPGAARSMADQEAGNLLFTLIDRFAGSGAQMVAALMLCTSLLASYIAIHNAAARYIFAIAREKLLPKALGEFHPQRYAPSNASISVSIVTGCALIFFLFADAAPYRTLVPGLIGFGTLGVIIIQALAAIAMVAFFSTRAGQRKAVTLVASLLAALGLVAAAYLVASHFELLALDSSQLVVHLPWVYPVIMVAGLMFAIWLKHKKPATYAKLAEANIRADVSRSLPKIPYDQHYCIVGAGPCGLLAARAFKLAGIPYDQFERYQDVGGIWDIDNPGSSMYESAHFISSKYTSGFFGFPMPDDFPDYPDNRQLLAYIRDFATHFGLREKIMFNTEVLSAVPIGENASEGWRVTLSNGEVRVYRGIICAPGVTWHPNAPEYPGLDLFKGEVRHAVTHRAATDFKGKRVLVVGSGNSGVDIACDAASMADAAFVSLRRGYRFIPKHIFGIPTDVFLSGEVHLPKGVVIPDQVDDLLDALTGDITRYGLPAPDHKLLETHPILNDQIFHYLAHGDLKVKPAIERFTSTGVRFVDGSEEAFDLVLFATGYEYRIPYLDETMFEWKQGHPLLYLNVFHRKMQGLSIIGFIEFASAGYQRFDEMAQMAAMDAYIRQSGQGLEEWNHMKAEHYPDLRGGNRYVDSPRHANYVNVAIYRSLLSEIREKFGWIDPGHSTYDPLRQSASTPAADVKKPSAKAA
jgi:amino acid transporter